MGANKNILIICTSLNLGGSERQAVWLANKLTESSYQVFFVSLKDSGILSHELDERVIVKNFKIGKARSIFSKIYYVFLGIAKLIKLSNSNNIGITISYLFHSNLVGKLVKKFSRHNNLHIVTFRSDRLSKRDSKESHIRTFILKNLILDKKTLVVFNSKTGQRKLNLKGVSQHVIYNSPLNISYKQNKLTNKFVYIGRLDELKNVKSLVLAISSLNKEENIELDIFGKGPELPELKRIVEHNQLSNAINFKEIDTSISNRLDEYRALLLVSTHEAFPNVIIEAMNLGVVPIATKVGDVEWLLDEDRGILIEGFDYHSIANGINTFLALSSNQKLEMQERGKSFVSSELNEQRIYEQWLKLIN
tara:strand:+ start:6299 stop:7387 length:1089 start_codon:yes stop_codon:yes gene_type:complete